MSKRKAVADHDPDAGLSLRDRLITIRRGFVRLAESFRQAGDSDAADDCALQAGVTARMIDRLERIETRQ